MVLGARHVRKARLQDEFEQVADERDDQKDRRESLPCRFDPAERLDQSPSDTGKSETKAELDQSGT